MLMATTQCRPHNDEREKTSEKAKDREKANLFAKERVCKWLKKKSDMIYATILDKLM